MTPEQRQRIIELLQAGGDLDPEWERILFPPGKREYELVYDGKERAEEILADTMSVPLQPVRTFGRNGDWSNMLIFGDNLQAMKTLLEMKRRGELTNADGSAGVRLAYIDPPFATKRDFRGSKEQKAYQDKIVGVEFLEFLRRRLILIRELLADDGVLFVHTDWKKGHYIKILLDELFGESRFRNEIVWWYYNKMQGNVNRFPSNHEIIFFYSAGSTFPFKAIMEERPDGKSRLLKRAWDGKTKRLVNVKGKDGKVMYIDVEDKRVDDVWRLSMLQPADRSENVGYPTQKPESLLAMIVEATSHPGDLVMDCFAGSGTTLAVAEKLERRWVGIDCGKLALYTMQKRLLNLRTEVGNKKGRQLKPKPFTLYNAGLYDFSRLRELPWDDWRFFALQLFQCKDQPHTIGGVALDGFLKGADVLIFNHFETPGARVTYDTIDDLHEAIGKKVGRKFFIVAPALSFSFQEDYVDRNGTRYYALRIPYSIINELHRRDFTAIRQPADEAEVNDTVEAVGFDFIRTPAAKLSYRLRKPNGSLFESLTVRVTTFRSEVVSPGAPELENLESLSMLLVDVDYDGEVFDMDRSFFREQLKADKYTVDIPVDTIGERVMLVLLDIHGNEYREVKTAAELGIKKPSPNGSTKKTKKKATTKKRSPRNHATTPKR